MESLRTASGSVGRGVVVLAAVMGILAALKLGAAVVGPLLLIVFFAILCRPVYAWLLRRLPAGLALLALALALLGVVVVLGAIVGVSVVQLGANLDEYSASLAERLGTAGDWLDQLGLERSASSAETAAAAAGAMVAVVAGLVAAIGSAATSGLYALIAILFLVSEGPMLATRFREWLGMDHPVSTRMVAFSRGVVHFFGLRAMLNALTGAGFALALLLLGVDFAALWGVLLFFLSFVPYIGIFLAAVPPVILAFAEYGIARALLVIVGITIVNLSLENIIMPRWVGRSFQMPAFVVYISFFWWTWLLGAPGALLGTVMTLATALLLDSFPSTRGLARVLAVLDQAPPAPAAAPLPDPADA